jgi:hypothetical protein
MSNIRLRLRGGRYVAPGAPAPAARYSDANTPAGGITLRAGLLARQASDEWPGAVGLPTHSGSVANADALITEINNIKAALPANNSNRYLLEVEDGTAGGWLKSPDTSGFGHANFWLGTSDFSAGGGWLKIAPKAGNNPLLGMQFYFNGGRGIEFNGIRNCGTSKVGASLPAIYQGRNGSMDSILNVPLLKFVNCQTGGFLRPGAVDTDWNTWMIGMQFYTASQLILENLLFHGLSVCVSGAPAYLRADNIEFRKFLNMGFQLANGYSGLEYPAGSVPDWNRWIIREILYRDPFDRVDLTQPTNDLDTFHRDLIQILQGVPGYGIRLLLEDVVMNDSSRIDALFEGGTKWRTEGTSFFRINFDGLIEAILGFNVAFNQQVTGIDARGGPGSKIYDIQNTLLGPAAIPPNTNELYLQRTVAYNAAEIYVRNQVAGDVPIIATGSPTIDNQGFKQCRWGPTAVAGERYGDLFNGTFAQDPSMRNYWFHTLDDDATLSVAAYKSAARALATAKIGTAWGWRAP